MSEIAFMQSEHKKWVTKNFPDQKPHHGLLGICEEAGELCHAHLKMEQGIRNMDSGAYRTLAEDALGDIFIFMLSYATSNGIDLSTAIQDTFMRVMNRDWVADPSGESA